MSCLISTEDIIGYITALTVFTLITGEVIFWVSTLEKFFTSSLQML
jgi:hypothetical protein